jgi:Na+/melibiose symporter-like transporter
LYRRRDRLISLRNGFTYLANFTVLGVALIIFATYTLPGIDNYQEIQIHQFRILGIFIVSLGSCTSLFYMLVIKEVFLTNEAKKYDKEYKRA